MWFCLTLYSSMLFKFLNWGLCHTDTLSITCVLVCEGGQGLSGGTLRGQQRTLWWHMALNMHTDTVHTHSYSHKTAHTAGLCVRVCVRYFFCQRSPTVITLITHNTLRHVHMVSDTRVSAYLKFQLCLTFISAGYCWRQVTVCDTRNLAPHKRRPQVSNAAPLYCSFVQKSKSTLFQSLLALRTMAAITLSPQSVPLNHWAVQQIKG